MILSMKRCAHGLGLLGVLCCGLAQAGVAEDATKLRGGTFVCGGNHFARIGGEELHRTVYVISNPNPHVTVKIDRMRLFDANGNTLFDFPGDEFPASSKSKLGPLETTQINSFDILKNELMPTERPIQTHIEWSLSDSRRVRAPSVGLVRTVRSASSGEERSRASAECRLIELRR